MTDEQVVTIVAAVTIAGREIRMAIARPESGEWGYYDGSDAIRDAWKLLALAKEMTPCPRP